MPRAPRAPSAWGRGAGGGRSRGLEGAVRPGHGDVGIGDRGVLRKEGSGHMGLGGAQGSLQPQAMGVWGWGMWG